MKRIQVRHLHADHLNRVAIINDNAYKIKGIEHHPSSGTWLELEEQGYADGWMRFGVGDTLIEFKEEE